MAHKSKTQRAKASASKANKKDRQIREEVNGIVTSVDVAEEVEEAKEGIFNNLKKKKEERKEREKKANAAAAAASKKEDKPAKKVRFKFFKDVKAELKRVTWPTRTDVLRWSGVVICALLFFGVFVAVLDNVIVTPALVALSGLGA